MADPAKNVMLSPEDMTDEDRDVLRIVGRRVSMGEPATIEDLCDHMDLSREDVIVSLDRLWRMGLIFSEHNPPIRQ